MRLSNIKYIAIALVFGAAALAFQAAPASAKSACKGLVQGTCSSNNSCSWVGNYKTKSGKSVKAHCRTKSSKGAAKKVRATKMKKAKAKMKSDGSKMKETAKAKMKAKAVDADMKAKK